MFPGSLKFQSEHKSQSSQKNKIRAHHDVKVTLI